jgi:hypothetical protein
MLPAIVTISRSDRGNFICIDVNIITIASFTTATTATTTTTTFTFTTT